MKQSPTSTRRPTTLGRRGNSSGRTGRRTSSKRPRQRPLDLPRSVSRAGRTSERRGAGRIAGPSPRARQGKSRGDPAAATSRPATLPKTVWIGQQPRDAVSLSWLIAAPGQQATDHSAGSGESRDDPRAATTAERLRMPELGESADPGSRRVVRGQRPCSARRLKAIEPTP